jgi:hypothetical protein
LDARRHERFNTDLTINLDQGDAVMRNVSATGLYFVTDVDLKPGDPLKFTLEFSGLQIGVVSAHCEARVVRVAPDGSLTGVGAAFDSIEFRRMPLKEERR